MRAGLNLYLLTLCAYYALAADEETTRLVNAMNDIFKNPGWTDMKGLNRIQIAVQPVGDEERTLCKRDLLAPGPDGRIVNGENAESKARQAHQLLSCYYARKLKKRYDYSTVAVHQCDRLGSFDETFVCVKSFVGFIKNIDRMVVRYQGALSCIENLSPRIPFDKGVSKAMKEFKGYYDGLKVNKNDHNDILVSAAKMVDTTRKRLSEFYKTFCRPFSERVENGFSTTANNPKKVDGELSPSTAMKVLKLNIHDDVKSAVKKFDKHSVGFKYHLTQKAKNHFSHNK